MKLAANLMLLIYLHRDQGILLAIDVRQNLFGRTTTYNTKLSLAYLLAAHVAYFTTRAARKSVD